MEPILGTRKPVQIATIVKDMEHCYPASKDNPPRFRHPRI